MIAWEPLYQMLELNNLGPRNMLLKLNILCSACSNICAYIGKGVCFTCKAVSGSFQEIWRVQRAVETPDFEFYVQASCCAWEDTHRAGCKPITSQGNNAKSIFLTISDCCLHNITHLVPHENSTLKLGIGKL